MFSLCFSMREILQRPGEKKNIGKITGGGGGGGGYWGDGGVKFISHFISRFKIFSTLQFFWGKY